MTAPSPAVDNAADTQTCAFCLHRQRVDSGVELRDCPFSLALDEGIDLEDWAKREDVALFMRVKDGWFFPDAGDGQ